MKADPDGLPATGSSARTLGARIDGPIRDIAVAPDGSVSPGTGGMSVALGVARNLHALVEPAFVRLFDILSIYQRDLWETRLS